MPPRKSPTTYQTITTLRKIFITLHKRHLHSIERIASVTHPLFLFMLMSPSLMPSDLKQALDAYMAATYIRETKREALDLSLMMNTLCVHLNLTVKCGQCHQDKTSFYVKKHSRMVECETCHFRDAVTEASWEALRANLLCLGEKQLMHNPRGEVYAHRNGGLQAFFRQGHICLYNSRVLGIQEQMLQQDQETLDLDCNEDLRDLCQSREPGVTVSLEEVKDDDDPLLAHPAPPSPSPPPPPFPSLDPNDCLLSLNDWDHTPLFESRHHDFSVDPPVKPGTKRTREPPQKECSTPESSLRGKRFVKRRNIVY